MNIRSLPRKEWLLTIAMWVMVLVIAFAPVAANAGIFSRSPKPEPQPEKESLVQSVSSGVSNAADSISNMANRVQHTITDPFRSDPSKQFLDDSEKAIKDLEDLTQQKTDELLEEAKRIKDKYATIDESWSDEAKRKAKQFQRRLRWRTSSLQSLKDSFEYASDYVQDFFDDLKESAKDTWESTKDWTKEKAESTKDWTKEKAETGKEYAESGKEYMEEQANRLAAAFPDLMRAGKDELSRRFSRENLEATWDEAEENMELAAQSIWDSDLSIDARTRMQNLLNNGSAFARGVYLDTREMFARAKKEGRNRQEAMADTAGQLRDFMQEQARESKSTIRRMGEKLVGNSDEQCSEVKARYDSVADIIRDMLEHMDPTTRARCIDEGVFDFAKRKTIEAKDSVVDTAANAKQSVIDAKDTVVDKAQQAKDTIVGVKDSAADAAAQARDTVIGVKDAAADKAQQAKESILDTKDAAADKAQQAKESILDTKDAAADKTQQAKQRAADAMDEGKLRLQKLKQRAQRTVNT